MQTESYPMTAQEHATVLAALRYYPQPGLADEPQKRPGAIPDIATGGDSAANAAAMNAADIDPLGERLNAPRKVEADSIARVLPPVRAFTGQANSTRPTAGASLRPRIGYRGRAD